MWNRNEVGRAGWNKQMSRLIPAVVFALLVSVAMPSRAADDRAVRSRVAPIYPEIAKRMKIGGSVRVSATVDAEGKVIEVKTITGNRTLAAAAEDAVRKWKYAAGTGDATVEIEINFTAPD